MLSFTGHYEPALAEIEIAELVEGSSMMKQ
jgi:hypothetical protein